MTEAKFTRGSLCWSNCKSSYPYKGCCKPCQQPNYTRQSTVKIQDDHWYAVSNKFNCNVVNYHFKNKSHFPKLNSILTKYGKVPCPTMYWGFPRRTPGGKLGGALLVEGGAEKSIKTTTFRKHKPTSFCKQWQIAANKQLQAFYR